MNVTLLFTYGVRLKDWEDTGIIDREIELYKQICKKHSINYTFLTFGDSEDLIYENLLENIEIFPIYSKYKYHKYSLVRFLYSFYIAYDLKNNINKFDLIKTNQMMGSWIAIILKIRSRKKLFIRTGYNIFYFAIKDKKSILKKISYFFLTQLTILFSNKYSVSSNTDANFINKYFFGARNKILIRPNWINLPKENKPILERERNKILSVGRLEYQKNFEYLINELADTDIELDIVGNGSLKNSLIKLSSEKNVKTNFLSNIPNHELLNKMNEYKIFCLMSHFEGNPKVVLESMSRGCVPVLSNISNNLDIVNNNVEGLLIKLNENQLKKALVDLINDDEKLEAMSSKAYNKIQKNNSFNNLMEQEVRDYKTILNS